MIDHLDSLPNSKLSVGAVLVWYCLKKRAPAKMAVTLVCLGNRHDTIVPAPPLLASWFSFIPLLTGVVVNMKSMRNDDDEPCWYVCTYVCVCTRVSRVLEQLLNFWSKVML